MAIRDLFWACPQCSASRPIRKERAGERCPSCRTIFRRSTGDLIEATLPDGKSVRRSAAEWLDGLPPLIEGDKPIRAGPEPVVVRFIQPQGKAVRRSGELLGYIEEYGPPNSASLLLDNLRITLTLEGGAQRFDLDAGRLTSIQLASRSLQVGLRGGKGWSLRFPEGSLRRWEAALQHAVRRWYLEAGLGQVLTFQPRIACR